MTGSAKVFAQANGCSFANSTQVNTSDPITGDTQALQDRNRLALTINVQTVSLEGTNIHCPQTPGTGHTPRSVDGIKMQLPDADPDGDSVKYMAHFGDFSVPINFDIYVVGEGS